MSNELNQPTDKELIIKMLTSVGLTIDTELWRSDDDTIGVEDNDGAVGFSFNPDGSFKAVWGRDW